EAANIPAPRADQSQPSCIGPTLSSSLAYTGSTHTKALAPRLKRVVMITSRNTIERLPKTNRNPTERSFTSDPAFAAFARSGEIVSLLRIGIRQSAEMRNVAAFT